MNSTKDSRQLLPDYMDPNSSVLSPRLRNVCDHVIRLTNDEIKRSAIHVDAIPVPTPTHKGPRAGRGKGRQKEVEKTNVIQVSSSMTQNSQGESSGGVGPQETVSQEDHLILLPKPRKRVRGREDVYDVDSDLVGFNLSYV